MSLPTLRETARALKRRLKFYRALLNDERTPRSAKWCLGLALGYLAMPFDLIPDFLPVIGHLDDAIIVPGLLLLALRLTPQSLRDNTKLLSTTPLSKTGLKARCGCRRRWPGRFESGA